MWQHRNQAFALAVGPTTCIVVCVANACAPSLLVSKHANLAPASRFSKPALSEDPHSAELLAAQSRIPPPLANASIMTVGVFGQLRSSQNQNRGFLTAAQHLVQLVACSHSGKCSLFRQRSEAERSDTEQRPFLALRVPFSIKLQTPGRCFATRTTG